MKVFLLFLPFVLSLTAYSQPVVKDRSANCITYWKLGEKKTYSIVHEKSGSGENVRPIRFIYNALVSVIDSTAESYTVRWEFQLPDIFKELHPHIADSLPVYDGMQMIFRISEMGAFIELLNWEEVKDAYIRQTEMPLSRHMDSTAKAVLAATEQMFSSKQVVESALIKEIQLFHKPYGYQFTTKEESETTQLPNPFGGAPFPARQTYQLTTLDEAKDAFALVVRLTIDKGDINSLMEPLLQRMNIKKNAEIEAAKEQMKNYDMQDYAEYHFVRSTGWLTRLFYKRSVSMGKNKQWESFTIELKN